MKIGDARRRQAVVRGDPDDLVPAEASETALAHADPNITRLSRLHRADFHLGQRRRSLVWPHPDAQPSPA